MRYFALLTSLTLTCAISLSTVRADDAPQIPANIQGDWKAVSINSNGADTPKDEIDKMQMTLHFADAKPGDGIDVVTLRRVPKP